MYHTLYIIIHMLMSDGVVCLDQALSCVCRRAEHRRGVSLLHLHGETERCPSLPTLLQTLLLQLHTGKSAVPSSSTLHSAVCRNVWN